MPVELHPHQQTAVDKMHNGCVLYGGVGTGKSITAMAYFVSKVCGGEYGRPGTMKTPKDVYVITTAKKRDSLDWELEAARFGILGDTRKSIENIKITVDSWNNIKDYVEEKDAFFIFDEQRVVGYGAWSRAFIKIARNNEWVLLSATPGDTWLDYIPVFIANGWYKHKTDFLDQHVIWTPRVKYPKVLRYQGLNKLVKYRNQVLVHMPYERHTTRHAVYVQCDYDQDAFDKAVNKRWHVFDKRPLRDVAELFSVMRKIVNSDESRSRSLTELMSKHPKLIVFYNFDYELEMLRQIRPPSATSSQTGSNEQDAWSYLLSPEGLVENCPGHWSEDQGKGEEFYHCHSKVLSSPCLVSARNISSVAEQSSPSRASTSSGSDAPAATFAIAEWNGHKHEEIPKTDSWLYLVQYRAGAEGWNCIETDAMVFWSQTYSYRDWWQAHGRIDRLNTPFTDLWYYHFISSSVIDKAIRAALRVKKNFNERDLAI
jgi:hypothetical protein